MSNIFNSDNIIQLSDIRERIEVLSKLRQPGPVDLGNDDDNEANQDDLFAELSALEDIASSCDYCSDNAFLIRESHFEDFAREEASSVGGIDVGDWPYCFIDWERAANAMQQDYKSIDFDGVTYLVRA